MNNYSNADRPGSFFIEIPWESGLNHQQFIHTTIGGVDFPQLCAEECIHGSTPDCNFFAFDGSVGSCGLGDLENAPDENAVSPPQEVLLMAKKGIKIGALNVILSLYVFSELCSACGRFYSTEPFPRRALHGHELACTTFSSL